MSQNVIFCHKNKMITIYSHVVSYIKSLDFMLVQYNVLLCFVLKLWEKYSHTVTLQEIQLYWKQMQLSDISFVLRILSF